MWDGTEGEEERARIGRGGACQGQAEVGLILSNQIVLTTTEGD